MVDMSTDAEYFAYQMKFLGISIGGLGELPGKNYGLGEHLQGLRSIEFLGLCEQQPWNVVWVEKTPNQTPMAESDNTAQRLDFQNQRPRLC